MNETAGRTSEASHQKWLPVLALSILTVLIIFQAWAFYYRLPLRLGPRVILQPWLMGRGFVMYENIIDLHSPLMPLILESLTPLIANGLKLAKLVLVVLLSLTTLLTLVVGWRKGGWFCGLSAVGFLVLWSPTFDFGFLWHESFLAPLYLILFLLYDPSRIRRSILAWLFIGFLGGVAILIKQHAVVVFAAFVLWSLAASWHHHRSRTLVLREAGFIGLGAILPVFTYMVFQYTQAGSLGGYFYWTIGYPLTSDFKSLAAQAPTKAEIQAVASSCLLMPAAFLCAVDARRKGDERWLHIGLGLTLAMASSATAYPRFGMFHLQATLPLIASVSALALGYVLRPGISSRFFAMGMSIALAAFWLITAGSAYSAAIAARKPKPVLWYSDLVPLAGEIRQYIGPTGCIYIFAEDEWNSNLYYLLRCAPPKFWIFHYPWYMDDRSRRQILLSLDANPPEWVAYFPNRWNAESTAPEIMRYLQDHYRQGATFQWAGGAVELLRRLP